MRLFPALNYHLKRKPLPGYYVIEMSFLACCFQHTTIVRPVSLPVKTCFIHLLFTPSHYKSYIYISTHLFLSSQANQFPGTEPASLKSISILSSILRLGLPKCLLPSGFLTNSVCISGLLHTCYMSCPSQSFRFKISNYVRRRIRYVQLGIM